MPPQGQAKRNRERIAKVESRLGHVEQRLVAATTAGAAMIREVHSLRDELRRTLAEDELPPLAPAWGDGGD